ncbi:MAG: glycosyltransferase family 2 protein [Actinomycetota bacterium]
MGGTESESARRSGPRVSIIIIGFRSADRLRDCLASIGATPPEVSHETVVVANGATPDVLALLDAAEGIRVVHSEVNRGFAGGCNLGAASARGELLMLLNDDVEVLPGWLDALVATADAHPDAGAVGSRMLYTDGTLHEAGSLVWADGTTAAVGRGLPGDTRLWRHLRQVDYCSAAALLVRASAWAAVGGMDEGFHPGYCEDLDLCLAIQETGARVLYEPRSVVVHHESSTFEASSRGFVQRRSRARLVAKWAERLTSHEADPTHPGAFERAVHVARGFPRRVLVAAATLDAADWLRALAGGIDLGRHAVVVCSSEPPREDLGAALNGVGVEFVDEPLERHIARPWALYDAVVLGPGTEGRRSALDRHQPQAAVVEAAGTPAPGWQDALSAAMLGRSADQVRTRAAGAGGW